MKAIGLSTSCELQVRQSNTTKRTFQTVPSGADGQRGVKSTVLKAIYSSHLHSIGKGQNQNLIMTVTTKAPFSAFPTRSSAVRRQSSQPARHDGIYINTLLNE